MTKIILIGGFLELIELARANDYEVTGIIASPGYGEFCDIKILCNDENAINLTPYYKTLPLVLSPDQPSVRERLYNFYSKMGFSFSSLLSKKAEISNSATIGEGTVIQNGVNVSSKSSIGRFIKINTNSNIMHNVIIEDFTTIAPNAVILGNIIIGCNCYVGANSTLLPNIKICNNVIIGAGAVVTHSIDEPGAYIGNPARLLINS